MARTGDKWEVDKLDDSNWHAWKFQIKCLLMAEDVWEHVDGTAVQPDDTDARAKYEKARQKAMTINKGDGDLLQSNLSGNILYQSKGAVGHSKLTVREPHWLFLKRQYSTIYEDDRRSVSSRSPEEHEGNQ